MSGDDFRSFEEFWPFYVREHSTKLNRLLHFAGTGGALSALAMAAARRQELVAAAGSGVGYGAAWIGHFFVEQNTPATFQHPLWSLRADSPDVRQDGRRHDGRRGRARSRSPRAAKRMTLQRLAPTAPTASSNGEGAYVHVDPTSSTDPHSMN